jgi:type VI secretion system secreted protein Hcp
MALTGYLTIEGNNQGKIEGDCVQKGREDSILVYGFEHQIEIPTDIHTGLPTGQRIHKPITIEKKFDCSTPKIMQACTSGEQLNFFSIVIGLCILCPVGRPVCISVGISI